MGRRYLTYKYLPDKERYDCKNSSEGNLKDNLITYYPYQLQINLSFSYPAMPLFCNRLLLA